MPQPAPALACRSLSYAWGQQTALQQVDFQIPKGHLVGLLGPNGAGKTTLISLIAGLLRPGNGNVELQGQDIGALGPAARGQLGFVFQSVSLDRFMCVTDNLRFAAGLQGMSAKACDQRVEALMELVPIAPLLNRTVAGLSGGQQRLVDIARALIHTPNVLILDEPTNALDVPSKDAVWRTLTRLQAEAGLTLLVATHRMDEAGSCDAVVFLNQGRVHWQGTPAQALQQMPAQCVTATRPVNLTDWFVWTLQKDHSGE
ncbi:MAG TPA: ABC transporter ATP-binding protein [Limnobacter sp.]|uniref:ABC transporter ATP-binding protein n=1 Tax=Limnobacter sp. TaxID=2003368 RepID=UPI002ED83B58